MRALAVYLLAACHGKAATIDADVVANRDAAADAMPDAQATCTANGIPGSCLSVAKCYGSRAPTGALCAADPSSNIQCCTPRFADGITCDPDLVPTPNDGLVEEAGDTGCPAGMARVAAFCVDRFEASLVEDTHSWSPVFPPFGHTVRAVSLRNAVPQAYIKQTEAADACIAAGKRLCSDIEWLRACQGPSLSMYPYGNTLQPGVCNDARATDPAVELYGTTAPWIGDHLDSPCLDQLPNSLARTGAHAGCRSADGVFDMMGNVHEWTDDPTGTLRGGDFVDTSQHGTGCNYVLTSPTTFDWSYATGFRCCANATP